MAVCAEIQPLVVIYEAVSTLHVLLAMIKVMLSCNAISAMKTESAITSTPIHAILRRSYCCQGN